MRIVNRISAITIGTVFSFLFSFIGNAQNISISSNGAAPDESALLELNSTNKGFLITRADTANITSPALALMTLQPSDSCLYVYSGEAWKGLGGAGENCPQYKPVIEPCGIDSKTKIEVVTGANGTKWMDRNLGANQKATSKDDVNSYGDLYQWGRCADGHQSRYSSTTPTLSSTDNPGHGRFITSNSDWRDPRNDNLWQGVAGINNPCPPSFRLPTHAEFVAEKDEWDQLNLGSDEAFNSPLKLPVAGGRKIDGTMELYPDTRGNYWTSTIYNTTDALFLHFQDQSVVISYTERATAYSVRCIKD